MNHEQFVNDLMDNHVEFSEVQYGGNKQMTPSGGFPPIYTKDEAAKKIDVLFDVDDKKKREFEKKTDAVSVKDIIAKRRAVKPFIAT